MKKYHIRLRFAFASIICLACLISQSFAKNWTVSTADGSDKNVGTVEAPFATLQYAANKTAPGDTVWVKGSTYTVANDETPLNINHSGTANAWIVYSAVSGQIPIINFKGWSGISLKANYIEVAGLTIRGPYATLTLTKALNQPHSCANPSGKALPIYNGSGISVDGRNSKNQHHFRILNNEIYETGSGISMIQADYITLENNKIYNNSWYTIYGMSGISLYQL